MGTLEFLDSMDALLYTVPLCCINGLWYLSELAFTPKVEGATVNSLSAVQTSKLWSLHLGSPGTQQLATITKHARGLPCTLILHKFRFINKVVDANIWKEPAGLVDRQATTFGDRFHMDFNFMRASSTEYKK